MCFREHIPEEADLVLVELGQGVHRLFSQDTEHIVSAELISFLNNYVFLLPDINDQHLNRDAHSYELLLRDLLDLPNSPAVLSILTFALVFDALSIGEELYVSP